MFVGIDISKGSLMAHAIDQDGKDIFHSFKVKNNKPGCNKLIDFIYKHANQADFDVIKVAMEATNVYWEHSFRLINNSEKLNLNFKLSISTFNPKVVKNFKGAYNNLPKTDSVDTWVIADKLRFDRVSNSSVPEEVYRPLRELTRFRFKLVRNIHSEKSRALNLVFLKFSNFENEAPFKAFSEASLDQIITDLKKAARNSYRLKPKMNQAIAQTLSMTFDNIRFLQNQLNKSKKVIKKELKAIPQTLVTVPGIGVILSVGISSEIGDINRFNNQAALASYGGLTWSKHQSGSFIAEETSMTKTGNKYLRYYLVEASNSLRVHNEEYKKYYESQKHKHKRALVLTAHKFVRLVFALLSKGEIYQPRR